MQYKTSQTILSNEISLSNFTSVELKCAESREELVVGDEVIVVFKTKVTSDGNGVALILGAPEIVKVKNFVPFVERYIEYNISPPVPSTDVKPA